MATSSGGSLGIDMLHCRALHWLRSPYANNSEYALVTIPGVMVDFCRVDDTSHAISSAFKLDLSNVLFASTAGQSLTNVFTSIDEGAPMILRLKDTEGQLGESSVTASGSTLTYTAPANSRLVVLASDANGNAYQYVENLEDDVNKGILDLTNLTGLHSESDMSGKAWIEKDGMDGLVYSTNVIDIDFMSKKILQMTNPISLDKLTDATSEDKDVTSGKSSKSTGDNSLNVAMIFAILSVGVVLVIARRKKND